MRHKDYISEGYAVSESEIPIEMDYTNVSDDEKESRRQEFAAMLQARYKAARQMKTGFMVKCPVCRKPHLKKSYQHVFCSNRGSGNCKDYYWNTVDFDRAVRANEFNQ